VTQKAVRLTKGEDTILLAGGLPAPELFDSEGIAAAFQRVLSDRRVGDHLQYGVPEGSHELREALAGITTRRGVGATADRVVVSTGSQQAVDVVSTALVSPGDVILVERPSYLLALQLFALLRARVVAVRCDAEGLDPDAVEAAIRRHRPKLIYTMPTFQNPSGRTLAAERRAAIARTVEREGVYLLEDDPYSELRYDGSSVPPLAASAPEQVIYVSTLSKVLAPGLRVGWITCPSRLAPVLTAVKQAKDVHCSTVDQQAVARYLGDNDLDAHIRRLRRAYRPRRDGMLSALRLTLGDVAQWTTPDGGMFVWVTFGLPCDTGALLRAGLDAGVTFVPGENFFADRPQRNTLRLAFTCEPPSRIHEGIRRLGSARHRLCGAPRG
jgi:2-aminoadipate transaminase